MSIKPSTITAVLLADGWHQIRVSSFDEAEFSFASECGEYDDVLGVTPKTCPGFTFTEQDGRDVSGPVTSILAVRH